MRTGSTPSIVLACLLLSNLLRSSTGDRPAYPSFEYDVARTHEIKPHRSTIRLAAIRSGFHQLHLTLVVSAEGSVMEAEAEDRGDAEALQFWPQLQPEVRQWKFVPFEKDGKAVTAEVEEYLDLLPPERLPKKHVPPPALGKDSKVAITLRRSGCFGACPAYTVTVSTDGIMFKGGHFVPAAGRHTDRVDANEVRKLATRFVSADFYSMNSKYMANVTDVPAYWLSIAIDGRRKEVVDYSGEEEGMPAIITELEEAVDAFARTQRWIDCSDGLVQVLRTEKFNFETYEAQVILKESARRGEIKTMRELLDAGVPLKPLPAPKSKMAYEIAPFDRGGWLRAAGGDPEAVRLFIAAGASKDDQGDKDLALAEAVRAGKVEAIDELIAYGANPNADPSKALVTQSGGDISTQGKGAGSILIEAAESGNPDTVRAILRYHPNLGLRDDKGRTALFAAGRSGRKDREGARVECVRLLAKAGADVSARDTRGNTPLHKTDLADVAEELLKLGADVNARNQAGETPLFTIAGGDAMQLLLEHGADLSIRNNNGETAVEAAGREDPARQEALRKAIEKFNRR